MRPPQREDDEGDGEPAQTLKALIGLGGGHVVDDVVEAAEAGDAAADAGRAILIAADVHAHRVRGGGAFAHRAQVQADLRAEEHIGSGEGDDHGEEEHHAEVLKRVGSSRERPAVQLLRADEVHGIVHLGHDDLHQTHTERGHGKAGHVLVGAQRNRQEAVDQAHQQTHGERTQNAQQDDQEAGKRGFADQVQHQTAARAAHAHHAGNAEVQLAGLFRKDFAGGAVHEGRAKGEGIDQEVHPDAHLMSSFRTARALRRSFTL